MGWNDFRNTKRRNSTYVVDIDSMYNTFNTDFIAYLSNNIFLIFVTKTLIKLKKI